MGKWDEALNEAPFKRVKDGFVFREPSLRPHHYLVSEAQKAELQKLTRLQQSWLFVAMGILWMVLGLAQWAGKSRFWPLFIAMGMAWILQPNRAWRASFGQIGPVLERARYTEQRITWRERNETIARMLPMSAPLVSGLASLACALISIGAAITFFDESFAPSYEPEVPGKVWEWYGSIHVVISYLGIGLWIVMVSLFLLLAARFFYLTFIKFTLGRGV